MRVSLSSRLRSQEGIAIQMGGVPQYKMEVLCSAFQTRLYWLGAPKHCAQSRAREGITKDLCDKEFAKVVDELCVVRLASISYFY